LLELEHIVGGRVGCWWWSQDSVVFVMIWLLDARSGVRILAGTRIFLLSKMSKLAMCPTQPPIQWVLMFLHGRKVIRTQSSVLTSICCWG